jgi:hypothetical protein
MQTNEIASPMVDCKMQSFVAGDSVSCAFITQEERTGPAIDRTGEEASAMECYGAVAMNYIQLSALGRSNEGASRCSPVTNVERDNQVFADLAGRASVIEAWEKLSACRLSSASFSARQR